ncbi:MAG: sigma-70 family RNA polymerase sigma factor [Phycisphaerales bacterium]|nr:sigma-70 family RNA polymerase sigma factor [Phycisphaerales bacterium]
MDASSPHELELTPDLLDYAKAVALNEARKWCPKRIEFKDVVQDALMHLMSKPPKYDPARGASPKTLIYTIVQRAVMKFTTREARHAGRSKRFDESVGAPAITEDGFYSDEEPSHHLVPERRTDELTLEDILENVDNEDSRALCRLFIECDCNISVTARRLRMTEGTVRYRLKLLAPKLRAAGFDPKGDGT